MAVDALVGSVLVNHDVLVSNGASFEVALGARNVGVSAGQLEMGLGVMVEGGGDPALGRVAIGAVGQMIPSKELTVMSVLMTCLALCWSAFEAGLSVGVGLMAISAGDGAMGA